MARRTGDAPVRMKVAELATKRPARPRIGGGRNFPINRNDLGARGSLRRRCVEFSVAELAGVEI
jgi:hypothetical protein